VETDGARDCSQQSAIQTQATNTETCAIDGLTGVFSDKVRRADNEAEVKELMPRSVNWRSKTIFVTRAEAMSPTERKAMIQRPGKFEPDR
jgi:hypothetical protein